MQVGEKKDKKYKNRFIKNIKYLEKIDLWLGKYNNIINLLFTSIGFLFTIISVFIATSSLEESKKAFDLTTNGSNLEVSLATQEVYKGKNGWIQKNYKKIKDGEVIVGNKFEDGTFFIEDDQFRNIGTGILTIFIKNTGYAPAKDISLKLNYENIISKPYSNNLKSTVVENKTGWRFRQSDCYAIGNSHKGDKRREKSYKSQIWDSNFEDVIIYPGETYDIKLNVWGGEQLYMIGDKGKIKVAITSSNSIYKETEFTIIKN